MKSYFALGVFAALSWAGLAGVAHAQQPYSYSSPSLLPLNEPAREYPTTPYPQTPSGPVELGQAGYSSTPSYAPAPNYGPTPAAAPGYAPASGYAPAPGYSPQYTSTPANAPQNAPVESRGPFFGQRFGNSAPPADPQQGGGMPRGQFFGQRFANNNTPAYNNVPSGNYNSTPGNYGPTYGTSAPTAPGGQGQPYELVPTPAGQPGVGPMGTQPRSYLDPSPYGSNWHGAEGGYGDECGDACCYGGGCCGHHWWGSLGGLVMGRNLGNPYYFSVFDGALGDRYLPQQYNWGGGVQASIGKRICCGQYGLEAVYWGIYPSINEQVVSEFQGPGNLNAFLDFANLDYDGVNAATLTDDAIRHRLQSTYQVQNFEFNFLNFTCAGLSTGCAPSRCSYTFGAGMRWFRFRDGLQFATDTTDGVFNFDPEELYYTVSNTNDLIGFQLLGQGNYCLCKRVNANLGSKFGVYGNHIQQTQYIGGSHGVAVINNNVFDGTAFNFATQTNTVSFLGEINAGLTWAATCRWSFYGGYRVVAASNVALASNQLHQDLEDANNIRQINFNGTLLLHGAYAGGQFCW